MFAYIEGKLVEYSASSAIVEANGIGYRIWIPASSLRNLPQLGQQVKLFASLVVRELSQTLYGFCSSSERDLFEVLINVSGIGPRTALSLIGHLPLKEFRQAVLQNDLLKISKVPGIGKKTAERLVIEMRDKLPGLFQTGQAGSTPELVLDYHSDKVRDALSALINLGYTQAKAQKAIEQTLSKEIDETDLASLITAALKHV